MGANEKIENFGQLQTVTVSLPQSINMCLLTRERFADLVGLSHATVYSMCDRGYLPTLHLSGGRRVFVNMEALRAQCAAKALL